MNMNTTRIAGIILSVTLFVIWIVVDMLFFADIGTALGYPTFEVVAYGSWFIIVLIILGILSVTGNIPSRQVE